MTPKIRIDFESARDHLNRERRSHAVSDDQDLVDCGIAAARDEFCGKTIYSCFDVWPTAMHVLPRKNPVVQPVLYAPSPTRPVQKSNEDGRTQRDEQGSL